MGPQELGIPVRAAFHSSLYPGEHNGQASLLAVMGQSVGGFLVLDVKLNSDGCTQYECGYPGAFEASASFRSPTSGVVYAGSCYTGWLHRYVPGSDAIEDLGSVDEEHATFPCRIDEAPDGSLFIGAYPGCCLSRYVPATGEWTRYGRMDDTDMYFYPLCGADGTVAGLVRMCRVQVVALDPETGEHRKIGPVVDVQEQSGATIDLLKGIDGLLYIQSSEGNYRVSGLDAVPVDDIPAPQPDPTLPDGSQAVFLDAKSFCHRTVEITSPTGDTRIVNLNWTGNGTDVFRIHEGPDGRVYGSSILPEHLFSCLPDGSDMIDHGQCSISGGEAYSMGNLDGLIYIASYPAARLSIYDPAKPYNFGTEPGSNPRDIGRVDDVAYRPNAMCAGPAGKVWIGSIPDYGMWGGTLASFDPKSETLTSHRHLIQDCSVTTVTWLDGLQRLIVGTAIGGGTGTQPRAPRAAFVLWDVEKDAADRTENFGFDNIEGVLDVAACPDGRHIYTTVVFMEPAGAEHPLSAALLLIDVGDGRIVDRTELGYEHGWPKDHALQIGSDGLFYGATACQIYRIKPGSTEREILWRTTLEDTKNHVSVAGPIVEGRYFFASGHRLRALSLGG